MDELEALFITLGMKPDDASVSASVKEMIQKLQQNLKSSVYGGKNGVITLPATIEGKFKNGKEINQEIKDAYAAIYEKAKQMADESVSLTLNDIKEFKAQIDKFGKKTAKYKGSDVIANANNNLRQTLSEYQTFINDLRKEASAIQKVQVKQNQKAKAQKKAKEKKSNYHGITDEEIDDAIAKENARQAKIKAWRDKQAEQLASRLGYKSSSPGPDPSRTNDYSLNASEFSEYESQWARELAKTIKETYRTTIDKQWIDKEYKPKTGAKSRATTREEYLNFLSNAAFGDLVDLIAKAEKGKEEVTFDQIVEAIGVMRTIYEENGKSMDVVAKKVIDATQIRYDDDSKRKNGGVNREEGTEKGVGKGHERTQVYQASIQQLLKKMLGEVNDIKEKEIEANKITAKMTSAYEKVKADAKTSQATAETKQIANEVKGETSRDLKSYRQDVRESSAERQADTAEAQKNQEIVNVSTENKDTGFDTNENTEPVKKDLNEIKKELTNKKDEKEEINFEQLKNAITNPLAEGKCPCEEILKSIQKTLSAINGHTNAISKKLGNRKKDSKQKDASRKKTLESKDTTSTRDDSSEMNKSLPTIVEKSLEPVQTALVPVQKSLDVLRDKFGKPVDTKKDLKMSLRGVSQYDLITKRSAEQIEKASKIALEKNEDKKINTSEKINTEGFNILAPAVIDKFTAMSQGLGKAFGIIQKTETPFGVGKSPVDTSKTEDIELPNWRKTEQAIERETQRIKDEENARTQLTNQIALEAKMAEKRNAKKQKLEIPNTIELDGDKEQILPMIIDKFTAIAQGLEKSFGIIQKIEIPFGKSPIVHNKTESKDPTMERLPAFIQKILQENRPKIDDLPDWAKTQRASEAQAQTIKDEEEARKRLADQIALETKMAKQRNAKKQRPKTQATIELGPEAGKEVGNSLQDTLKKIFSKITGESEASRIMNMSERERAKETAERMRKYGKPRGRGEAGDRGVISDIRYSKNYWRGKDAASGPDDPLYRDIRKTDPVDGVDVDKVMEALQTAIEKNMFNAQTGGGWKAAMAASLTGGLAYAFQPSMEKTRAEVDGLNTVMADVRNQVLKILEDIKGKQAVLGEMQENGDIEFDDQGRQISGTPEATALFNELENSKDILDSLLSEMGNIDKVIKECGGDVSKIIKNLGFVAPELRKDNVILKNISAGLDKNGKALKYQTRMGEVLNYSFQLMARSIGQMFKNWLSLLNPINLVKKAFSDFASYDVKWQRTLNVIKYNLRRIIRPAMEWIAQQIVNIIGLVNALLKGTGKVFGKNWDLFDKSAASAEQMREELEQAANVTASFDELHDIGTESSGNPALDLTGDIYTPQWEDLYKKIEDFGKKIGDMLKGIHDLTKGWSFWKWLTIAGAALLGLRALKWLIGLFTGKNPLKSVADGFSFLEKAVGWALLIAAFALFTKELKEFIDVVGHMKPEEVKQAMIALAEGIGILVVAILSLEIITAVLEKFLSFDWKSLFGLAAEVGALAYFVDVLTDFISTVGTMKEEDVAQALKALAIAFTELAIAIGVLEVVTALIQKFLGLNWGSLFGIAALVGAFALFTDAMAKFAEAIKGLTNDDVINGLKLLGGAFLELVVAIGLLAAIASIIPITAVPVLAVFALVIAAVALLVLAMSEFVKALHDNGEDVKLFLEGIAIVLRTFGDVVVEILSTIGDFIIDLLGTVGDFIIDLLRTISDTIIGIITALLEGAANIILSTLEGVATIITSILNGIAEAFRAIGDVIRDIIEGIAVAIATIVTAIADGIRNVLQPILDFVDSVIDKVTELATTIVHEIGETIRTVIETVGNVILGIIDSITNAIPNLLNAILNFIGGIGPAVENTADSIMRTITKVVNFTVSAIEYLINLVVDGVNGIISAVNSVSQYVGINIPRVPKVTIQRFVPQYAVGTNYVPNDGLAYLHQGEAVIPKKYNQPYQPADNAKLENAINQLNQQVAQIGNKVNEGIAVKGQFIQKGSDLVATVEKANNRMKNNVLNNRVYAR